MAINNDYEQALESIRGLRRKPLSDPLSDIERQYVKEIEEALKEQRENEDEFKKEKESIEKNQGMLSRLISFIPYAEPAELAQLKENYEKKKAQNEKRIEISKDNYKNESRWFEAKQRAEEKLNGILSNKVLAGEQRTKLLHQMTNVEYNRIKKLEREKSHEFSESKEKRTQEEVENAIGDHFAKLIKIDLEKTIRDYTSFQTLPENLRTALENDLKRTLVMIARLEEETEQSRHNELKRNMYNEQLKENKSKLHELQNKIETAIRLQETKQFKEFSVITDDDVRTEIMLDTIDSIRKNKKECMDKAVKKLNTFDRAFLLDPNTDAKNMLDSLVVREERLQIRRNIDSMVVRIANYVEILNPRAVALDAALSKLAAEEDKVIRANESRLRKEITKEINEIIEKKLKVIEGDIQSKIDAEMHSNPHFQSIRDKSLQDDFKARLTRFSLEMEKIKLGFVEHSSTNIIRLNVFLKRIRREISVGAEMQNITNFAAIKDLARKKELIREMTKSVFREDKENVELITKQILERDYSTEGREFSSVYERAKDFFRRGRDAVADLFDNDTFYAVALGAGAGAGIASPFAGIPIIGPIAVGATTLLGGFLAYRNKEILKYPIVVAKEMVKSVGYVFGEIADIYDTFKIGVQRALKNGIGNGWRHLMDATVRTIGTLAAGSAIGYGLVTLGILAGLSNPLSAGAIILGLVGVYATAFVSKKIRVASNIVINKDKDKYGLTTKAKTILGKDADAVHRYFVNEIENCKKAIAKLPVSSAESRIKQRILSELETTWEKIRNGDKAYHAHWQVSARHIYLLEYNQYLEGLGKHSKEISERFMNTVLTEEKRKHGIESHSKELKEKAGSAVTSPELDKKHREVPHKEKEHLKKSHVAFSYEGEKEIRQTEKRLDEFLNIHRKLSKSVKEKEKPKLD